MRYRNPYQLKKQRERTRAREMSAPATSAVSGSPEAPLTALVGEAGVVGSPARTAQATGARAAGLSPDMTKGAARNSAPVETTTAS